MRKLLELILGTFFIWFPIVRRDNSRKNISNLIIGVDMLFRKNKKRKHICRWCNFEDLNFYYGVKSYNDIPIYDFDYYKLERDNCKYCGTEFYYLVDLEKGVDIWKLKMYMIKKIEK